MKDESRTSAEMKALGQISFAQDALKGIVTLNGGALIFLLTFFGQIWSKDSEQASIVMLSLKGGLLSFLAGTICGIVSQGTAYLSQQYFVDENNYWGKAYRKISITLSLFGIFFFALGSFKIINSFI
jgi:hypothetical protein